MSGAPTAVSGRNDKAASGQNTAAGAQASLRDWIAVGGAVLGAFMAVLDIQITNASLKDIQGGIAASLDEGTWISTSYLLAEIIVIPLTGWLSSVFAIRNYLLVNCALFLAFSVLCGLSTSLSEMIIFRAAQGFTGGVFIPMALTIVRLKLPPAKLSIGLALFGFTATFAPAIGPTIGGWLTDNFGWEYIFFINIIPGAVLLWAVWYGIHRQPMQLGRLRHGDWFGMLFMAIGLGSLEVVLEEGQRNDWFGSPLIRWLAISAGVGIAAFVTIELTRKEPFINLRLLGRRSFGATAIMALALGVGLYGSTYILPVYLGQVQGYDALQIGQVVMWAGLPQLFILPLLPLIMKYVDARYLVAFGFTLFAASAIINGFMSHDTAGPQLRVPQVIRALGQPFVMVPLSALATAGIAAAEQSGASSLFNICRNLGGSVGIAMLQTFATIREHYHFSVIGERVTQNGVMTQQRLNTMQNLFGSRNPGSGVTMLQAVEQLRNQVRNEAFTMAYSDGFLMMGVILAISACAVFLVAKPKPGGAGGAH